MANNFTDDSNCVTLWRFETVPGIDKDSIGNNDITMEGVIGEAIIIKEGTQSAKFLKIDSAKATIEDINLDAGFPFRDNDASPKKDITYCGWMYYITIPSVQGFDSRFFRKFESEGNNKTFQLSVKAGGDVVKIQKGYNSGISHETDTHSTALVASRWYLIGVGYRESDKSYYIYIWDDTAGAVHGTTLNAVFLQETSVRPSVLKIMAARNSDVYLDEVVIWNTKKTIGDINKVRQGTYNWKSFGNLSLNIQSLTNMTGGG